MNLKSPNICAKRGKKKQSLVYFQQISLPKIKTSKLKPLLEKTQVISKKTQAFWLQNSMNRKWVTTPHYHKSGQKKKACCTGRYTQWES